MLAIVTDNSKNSINGVVTTYNNILQYCNIPYKVVSCDDFFCVSAPTYSDISLAVWPRLNIHLRDAKYIHIATEGPIGLAAARWCNRNGRSYTSAYHTKLPEALEKRGIPKSWTVAYLKWFHSKARVTLVTTQSMKNELNYGNAVVWDRGIDEKIFYDHKCERQSLLYVGRLSAEKNVYDFCSLKSELPKVIVGEGPQLSELRKKFPNIEYRGWLTAKELAIEYSKAKVFVFPSKWDTFGLVLREAAACGAPVAAYDTENNREVLKNCVAALNENLQISVENALKLPNTSYVYTWENAWKIFAQHVLN